MVALARSFRGRDLANVNAYRAIRSMPRRVNTLVCVGQLVGCANVEPPANSAVLAFGVLANAHHVDVGGAASGQWRRDARQKPHGPQIDVLSQALPERKDQLTRRDMIGDTRIADCAQINRVELENLLDRVAVEHATVTEIELRAPGELCELTAKSALRCGGLKHFHSGRNHFLADAVTGNHCNAVGLHRSVILSRTRYRAHGREHERKRDSANACSSSITASLWVCGLSKRMPAP